MEGKRKYTRVALKDIKAAPQPGFYVTSEDTKAYCLMLGALFAFFSALTLFGSRGAKG